MMKDGGETSGSASNNGAPSPITATIGRTRDEQLSYADSLLGGKLIVSHGGTWTAEAREPDRRQQLLEQLRLARQLRATLEDAADTSEAFPRKARSLLREHAPQISTLTSLTEAVKGRYTLESYDYYTLEQQKRQQVEKRARDGLNAHVERMATEASTLREEVHGGGTEERQPERQRKRRTVARAPSIDESFADDSSVEDDDKDPLYTERPSRSSSPTKKRRTQRRRYSERRRCHDCKSTTSYFRRCHYWFVNGTKCGKAFCRKCLEAKYEAPAQDWDTAAERTDWHCPSCLGSCLCQQCSKKRERENRSASADRRASTRAVGPA